MQAVRRRRNRLPTQVHYHYPLVSSCSTSALSVAAGGNRRCDVGVYPGVGRGFAVSCRWVECYVPSLRNGDLACFKGKPGANS
jgi:hypothetical protein